MFTRWKRRSRSAGSPFGAPAPARDWRPARQVLTPSPRCPPLHHRPHNGSARAFSAVPPYRYAHIDATPHEAFSQPLIAASATAYDATRLRLTWWSSPLNSGNGTLLPYLRYPSIHSYPID
ncbi:unnamed protein product, partial [Iphiclides podalirius]